MSVSTAPRILSRAYWRDAAHAFADTRMLVFAGLIVALRVAVKLARVQLAAGLELSLDCYVNSIGSLIYGPLVGLAVGAVSDTLGCILFPTGAYFFPFIFVEMSSSFIFGLFFWRQSLSVPRVLMSKFTVNLVSNIILTSLIMKWDYYIFYGIEKAEAYAVINLTRIVKNLVLFPLEAVLIVLILRAALPALRHFRLTDSREDLRMSLRHYFITGGLFLLSVGLVLFYIFFLKDFVSLHNVKWL